MARTSGRASRNISKVRACAGGGREARPELFLLHQGSCSKKA